MNNLTCDIGYKSINHVGEQLCGDHVEIWDEEGYRSYTESTRTASIEEILKRNGL